MPTVSIIIPVYNVESQISKCLDSILGQTFTDFEVVLVDDGSKDASLSICKEYAEQDARINVIHQENKGVSQARNLGLSRCTGKYVTFIDSDDAILPSFLSNFSYDENIDFEIQGFIINYINEPEKNSTLQPTETKIDSLKNVLDETELKSLTRGPCCKLFKNEILKKHSIQFPLGISFGEDAIFVKYYLFYCGFYARTISSAEYLYNHYDNLNSLTKKRHSADSFYVYCWTDYKLYKQLELKLGAFSAELNEYFIHLRCLEFYWSIVLCMTEQTKSAEQKKSFIERVKREMFKEINTYSILPITYRLIRIILQYLPVNIAYRLLSIIAR